MNCPQWLAASLLASMTAAMGFEPPQPFGIWRNSKDSVHLDISRCGEALCGRVVWANDKAKADARKGGTDPLIGTELLRNFRTDGKGRWRGKVFVPDIGQTFYGTITPIDTSRLKARGCLFAGIVCRSKIWIRVEVSADRPNTAVPPGRPGL
jgi:uncharacterized protein (DUF2147 family)